jgi:hypothetical protein
VVHEGHQYTADIEGYDVASLRPKHEGSSLMQVGGETVEPGWIGSCGAPRSSLAPLLGVDAGSAAPTEDGIGPVQEPLTPYPGRIVTFRGCSLTALGTSPSSTQVSIDLDAALGSLECGNEAGQIASFEVTLGDVVKRGECGAAVTFADLTPGIFLEFSVVASEAGVGDAGVGGPIWTTTCYQEPSEGLDLTARCDPLIPSG